MTILGMHAHVRDRVHGGGGRPWDGPRAAVKIAKGERMTVALMGYLSDMHTVHLVINGYLALKK